MLELRVHVGLFVLYWRGCMFDFVSEVYVDGEFVWEGFVMMFKCGNVDDMLLCEVLVEVLLVIVCWWLFDDFGCRYVVVFGDYNFIYMYALVVKVFGFLCVIAYGMWMKVCCLVALWLLDVFEVLVRFIKLVLLLLMVMFGEVDGCFVVYGYLEGMCIVLSM